MAAKVWTWNRCYIFLVYDRTKRNHVQQNGNTDTGAQDTEVTGCFDYWLMFQFGFTLILWPEVSRGQTSWLQVEVCLFCQLGAALWGSTIQLAFHRLAPNQTIGARGQHSGPRCDRPNCGAHRALIQFNLIMWPYYFYINSTKPFQLSSELEWALICFNKVLLELKVQFWGLNWFLDISSIWCYYMSLHSD